MTRAFNEDGARARTFGIEEALTALVADQSLMGAHWPAVDPLDDPRVGRPETLLLDGGQLAGVRARLRVGDGDPSLVETLERLATTADAMPVESVTDKAEPGPSGDLHDYVSLARYWWPDEGAPTGLPYVRRDGEVNPEGATDRYDSSRLGRFSDGVVTLAICGFLLDDPRWSKSARERLTVWLLDPETRQNPHFDFAQLVRGHDWVRPPAVVDARRVLGAAEAFRLLRSERLLTSEESAGMQQWFTSVHSWLMSGPAPQAAVNARNNVAVWCLLERVALGDLIRDEVSVSQSLELAGDLLSQQVEPDGTLPAEWARANPADYSAFAFVAMAQLARIGELRGLGLWDRASADGRGLAATRAWLGAVGSADQRSAPRSDVTGLAMRLLAWRESTLREAIIRASRLADEVGRRDRKIAQLSAQLGRTQGETGRRDRIARAPRSDRRSRSDLAASIRTRAPQWPVVGSSGRLVKRTMRAYRRGRAGTPPRAAVSPASPETSERLMRAYRASALSQQPVTFVLYRILGNDLPPRHAPGQTLANVRFIVENEPELAGCEKRWVLNRIADPEVERDLLDLLEEHHQPVLRLPFDPEAYARQPYDLACLPRPDYLTTPGWAQSFPDVRARAVSAAYRFKNLYAMNNNGARNAALSDGRSRAMWILPFDGSIFITADAWNDLYTAVNERPEFPYVVVPMIRAADNADILSGTPLPASVEEPQIVFRADAGEIFDEARPYGRRPKVDLLWRLGVPGTWERWPKDAWDLPYPRPSADHGCFQVAGRAVRLATGTTHRDVPGPAGLRERGAIREEAIVSFLRTMDALEVERTWAPEQLAFYDADLLDEVRDGRLPSMRAAIVADAEAAVLRGPFSVTDKTTLPPSGNIHDYWHPAPYWWPNPSRPDGLPYRRRDGRRVPGTEMFSPHSDQFDRTSLHLALSDVTSLALAWWITGEMRYADHAAQQVRTWFVDESTAMTPHLEFAQVRRGHDGDRGQASGIIELKDLYYFLDAVRIIRKAGSLAPRDADRLDNWLDRYARWLLTSPQGCEERLAANNHGTCYDLQVMAISTYLGRGLDFADAALRATGRLHAHFDRTGAQPEELARTETRHYCAFNLQSWINLARIAEVGGCDLWHGPDGAASPLGHGIDWYLALQSGDGWPFRQAHPFDPRRDASIEAAGRLLREPSLSVLAAAADVVASTASSVMHAHDGAAPFWPLALGPRRRSGERAGHAR